MHVLLFVLAVLSFLFGSLVMLVAVGAIHQILGGIAFLHGAICLSGGAVVLAVRNKG